MIKDVAKYLEDNTDLTIGVTLFKGNQPDTPANCVTLYDTGGGEPEQEVSVDHPSIQVDCRGASNNYEATMERAREIFGLLNRKMNITICTKDVMYSRAVSSPQSLGLDENGRWRVMTNYTFQIRNS